MLYIYLPVLYYYGNLYVTKGSYAGGRGFPLSQRAFLFYRRLTDLIKEKCRLQILPLPVLEKTATGRSSIFIDYSNNARPLFHKTLKDVSCKDVFRLYETEPWSLLCVWLPPVPPFSPFL